jgi:uncharacterized delta-60 repeat protein
MAVYTRNNIVTNGLVLIMDVSNPISYASGSLNMSNMINQTVSASIPSTVQYNTITAPSLFLTSSQLTTNLQTYSTWSIGLVVKFDDISARLNASTGQTILFFNSASSAGVPGYTSLFLGTHYGVNSITTDSSGSIYVGGQFDGYQNTKRSFFFKLDTTGSLVNDFNIGQNNVYGVRTITQVQFDTSGSVYSTSTNINAGFFKSNKDTGALISSQPFGNSNISYAFTLDNTSSIYLCTSATTYQNSSSGFFVKINKDTYQRDFTFNTHTSGGMNTAIGNTVLFDTNQNLFLGGDFTTYQGVTVNRIVKINKDTAAQDTSFNMGVGFNAAVNKIIQSHDNKIYVIGDFTTYSGSSYNRIVKLNLDGTRDTSFNLGAGFNSSLNNIDIQSDGKLIAIGNFTSYSGSANNRIVRINTDGTKDTSFNPGTGFNLTVSALAIQPDGKILVGGNANNYNGTTFGNIIRLNSDGTIDPTFNITGGKVQTLYRVDMYSYAPTLNSIVGINPSGRVPYDYIYNEFGGFIYYNITYNPVTGAVRFYMNGRLRGSLSLAAGSNYPLWLKFLFGSETSYLSYLHAYDRELSQQEIFQNYNAIKTRFGLT